MERRIDEELKLVPYFPCPEVTLAWYQDRQLCLQMDNKDHVYTLEMLEDMYSYLNEKGECWYVQYQGTLVGDVTLLDERNEVCIVISHDYQNRHLGRRCIKAILDYAKEKGLPYVGASIYSFNEQSRKMFLSLGFREVDEEWFEYSLIEDEA